MELFSMVHVCEVGEFVQHYEIGEMSGQPDEVHVQVYVFLYGTAAPIPRDKRFAGYPPQYFLVGIRLQKFGFFLSGESPFVRNPHFRHWTGGICCLFKVFLTGFQYAVHILLYEHGGIAVPAIYRHGDGYSFRNPYSYVPASCRFPEAHFSESVEIYFFIRHVEIIGNNGCQQLCPAGTAGILRITGIGNIGGIRTVSDSDEVDFNDFVPSSGYSSDFLMELLQKTVEEIGDGELKRIVRAVLDEYGGKMKDLPAAFRLHHAIRGGLLMHTLSIVKMAKSVAAIYPTVDKDLLIAGAILHDVAKTEEFVVAPSGLVSTCCCRTTANRNLARQCVHHFWKRKSCRSWIYWTRAFTKLKTPC